MRARIQMAVVAAVALIASAAVAQEKSEGGQGGFDTKALEKLFEQYAKPGEPHEELAKLAGEWKTVTTSYWENAEKPEVSEGRAVFEPILGGRYVRQRFTGEYGGKKFEGLGVSGYDNFKKKYVSMWIDNMGTGIATSEGTMDEETDTLTEVGQTVTPFGVMRTRMKIHYISDDKFELTMWANMPGFDGERKVMDITYTRK